VFRSLLSRLWDKMMLWVSRHMAFIRKLVSSHSPSPSTSFSLVAVREVIRIYIATHGLKTPVVALPFHSW